MSGATIIDKVKDIQTGAVYARKCIVGISSKNITARSAVYREELKVMLRLPAHRHIIRPFATYNTASSVGLLIQPAADGGNLRHLLESLADEEGAEYKVMRADLRCGYGCLAGGLAFMHARRIRHRDIKLQNILVHGGIFPYADFGIAHDYSETEESVTEGVPDGVTRRYCAPEVLINGERS